MSVDVTGRTLVQSKEVHKGPAGVGFVLTKEGDFDIEKRRLRNVAAALEPHGAVNLENLKTIKENLKSNEENLKFIEEHLKIVEEKINQLTNSVRFVEKQIMVVNQHIP